MEKTKELIPEQGFYPVPVYLEAQSKEDEIFEIDNLLKHKL